MSSHQRIFSGVSGGWPFAVNNGNVAKSLREIADSIDANAAIVEKIEVTQTCDKENYARTKFEFTFVEKSPA